MANAYVRMNAPYAYLANKNVDSKYQLFICVPCYDNINPATPTPQLYNGTVQVTFHLTGHATDSGNPNYKFYSFEVVVPTGTSPSVAEINIKVVKDSNYYAPAGDTDAFDHEITLLFADADAQMPDLYADPKAFNSPYLYLTNPTAMDGGLNYTGRCLVNMKESSLKTQGKSTTGGVCSQTIELNAVTGAAETMLNPSLLDVNSGTYADSSSKNGNMNATVRKGGSTTTGKLKNKSSDTNPTIFITD
jgi:hypothetical protein